ncbi:MAG: hypothetical protein K6T27_06905 [Thermoleophilum sp.]|nr:hypothetical protein [Thermoleophilum sp.]
MELVTFDEAWTRLERHLPVRPTVSVSSWVPAEPRWLAQDVAAAVDLPPFSRSMMDGYAIHAEDLGADDTWLRVVADVRAGDAAAGPIDARLGSDDLRSVRVLDHDRRAGMDRLQRPSQHGLLQRVA